MFAKASICEKIKSLSLSSRQQLIRHLEGRA
jgi:hypothetical protein